MELSWKQTSAGEHHTKGVMERAVQMVGGMLRTHKLASEETYGREWQADHVVSLRLIMYAAVVISVLDVGSKGRTAYQRFRDNMWKSCSKVCTLTCDSKAQRCTSVRV